MIRLSSKYHLRIVHSQRCMCSVKEEPGKKPELAQAYQPSLVAQSEPHLNYFQPKIKSEKPFTMILPPPNITGVLHLGHALTVSIQDVIVRWKRMQGIETVWVPGFDHAGIATQVIVEKQLWNEKRQTRHDIGRELFVERIWKWKEEKVRIIENQLRQLGASLDWSRQIFTLDPSQNRAVITAFVRLFDAGLLYRADHPVNWSSILQSAISDIEVAHQEIDGPTLIQVPGYTEPVEFGTLTYFAYQFHDSKDEEIVVATTRPETMLGDVAVAVNPRDGRYGRHIGRYLWHPLRQRTIPIIADEFVDPEFGTGAVKVTPAHNTDDFEIGKRHKLQSVQVIDEKGCLYGEHFEKMPRFQGRTVILERLTKMGLMRGKDRHKMSVPICSRSGDVVEILVRPQWFLKCSEMGAKAAADLKSGKLEIQPEHFHKTWFTWLENTRDWCVSRQLWWGHRIPAYHCQIASESSTDSLWLAAPTSVEAQAKAAAHFSTQPQNVVVRQDEDVLDTWFSSALLPLTARGWPIMGTQSPKMGTEAPKVDASLLDSKDTPGPKSDMMGTQAPQLGSTKLDLMATGHDILFFWVARMVMLGRELSGQNPFDKVLLHGIVCDSRGRKMSKSLGNVVAPEDVICGASLENLENASRTNFKSGMLSEEELNNAIKGQKKMFPEGIPECGADALRFTLCSHNIKSHYINFDVQECHTNKLFCNKIWQATKFTNSWIEQVRFRQGQGEHIPHGSVEMCGIMDRWILSRLDHLVSVVANAMDHYELHQATGALKNFLYFDFCDVYLESTKRSLRAWSAAAFGHCWTLTICLDVALRTLAPFMPALSQYLHRRLDFYPGVDHQQTYFPQKLDFRDVALEKQIEEVLEVVVGIRRLKKIFGVSAKHNPEVFLERDDDESLFSTFQSVLEDLSGCNRVSVTSSLSRPALEALIKAENREMNGIVVVDQIGARTHIHLYVPGDLRATVSNNLDPVKLASKKAKLIKELERMDKMMSGSNYTVKATLEEQELHTKKVVTLKEKIDRIDYLRTLSKQF